jgi:hypothetical protein
MKPPPKIMNFLPYLLPAQCGTAVVDIKLHSFTPDPP